MVSNLYFNVYQDALLKYTLRHKKYLKWGWVLLEVRTIQVGFERLRAWQLPAVPLPRNTKVHFSAVFLFALNYNARRI